MATLANLVTKLGLDASGFHKGIDRVETHTRSVGSTVGGFLQDIASNTVGEIVAEGAIRGIGALSTGIRGVVGSGFELNNSMEQARARINAFTKDAGKTEEILTMVADRAAKTPFAFSEMANAAAALGPAAKQSQIPLQDLIAQAEILAASNPGEGLEGAVFSLREALSGDFVSIVERFNLPKQRLNELKEEGVPALQAIQTAMAEMGLDASLVANMATTMSGRWSTFKDTIVGVIGTITQPIFDSMSSGLGELQVKIDAAMPRIQEMASAIADKLGVAAAWFMDTVLPGMIAGIVQVATTVGGLVTAATNAYNAFQTFASFGTEWGINAALQSLAESFPMLTPLTDWLQTVVPTAVETARAAWATLSGHFTDVLLPALQTMTAWIIDNVPPAWAALVGAFQDGGIVAVLQTFLDKVGEFIPALEPLAAFVSDNLPVAIATLQGVVDAITTKFAEWWVAVGGWRGVLDTMVGVIDDVSGAVSGLIGWVNDSVIAQSALVGIAGALATAYALATVAALAHLAATTAQTAATWLASTAQAALNVVLSANPIGLVVIAIGALVSALVYAYNNSETFRAAVDELWASFLRGIDVVREWAAGVKERWDSTAADFKTSWNTIATTVSAVWNTIVTTVQTKIEEVRGFFSGLPGKIVSAVGDLSTVLVSAGVSVVQGLINGINQKWEAAKARFAEITGMIPDLKGPPERDRKLLYGAGELIMQGLVDGIDSEEQALEHSLGNVTDKIRSYFEILVEDGDYLNDYFSALPDNLQKGIDGLLKMAGIGSQASKDLGMYFQAIAEDGDHLNDWLSHLPEKMRGNAEKVGLLMANLLSGEAAGDKAKKSPGAKVQSQAESVEEAVKRVASVIDAGIKALQSLSTYEAVVTQEMIVRFSGQMDMVTAAVVSMSRKFAAGAIEHAAAFADGAGKMVGFVGNAVDALNSLAGYETGKLDRWLISRFSYDVLQVGRVLVDIASKFEIEAVGAAAAWAEASGVVFGLVGQAVSALDALAGYETGRINRWLISRFSYDMLQVVRVLIDIATKFDVEATEAAARFAEAGKTVLGIVVPAIQAFTALRDYEDVPTSALELVAADIDDAIWLLTEIANTADVEGAAAAGLFASSLDGVFELFTAGVNAFKAIRDYKSVPREAMVAVMADFEAAINLMIEIAARANTEGVLRAAEYAAASVTVFDYFKAGAGAIDAIRDYESVPADRMRAVLQDFEGAVWLMTEIARRADMEAVQRAAEYASAMGTVFGSFKAGTELIDSLREYESLPADRMQAFATDFELFIGFLGSLVERGQEAVRRAEAWRDLMSQAWQAIQAGQQYQGMIEGQSYATPTIPDYRTPPPPADPIPWFASGVRDFRGGLAYVHQGEVLADLPPGIDVIKASDVRSMFTGGDEGSITNVVFEPGSIVQRPFEDASQFADYVADRIDERSRESRRR